MLEECPFAIPVSTEKDLADPRPPVWKKYCGTWGPEDNTPLAVLAADNWSLAFLPLVHVLRTTVVNSNLDHEDIDGIASLCHALETLGEDFRAILNLLYRTLQYDPAMRRLVESAQILYRPEDSEADTKTLLS